MNFYLAIVHSKCMIAHPRCTSWRTSTGAEVDFVVNTGSVLVPIEVKTSATPRPAMASGIVAFRELLGTKAAPGYVVHAGEVRFRSPRASRPCHSRSSSRLLKKTICGHPPAVGTRALPRRCDVRAKYASHLGSGSALHLAIFEPPGQIRVLQQPASVLSQRFAA